MSELSKKTEKNREKMKKQFGKTQLRWDDVIDGFYPERLRENLEIKEYGLKPIKKKCQRLSLELTGISNKKLDNETEIDLIEDNNVDNQGVDSNNEIVKNYVYKSTLRL